MASLTAAASRTLARSALRPQSSLSCARALSTSSALRDSASSSSYESPFKGEPKTTKVPDFSKYLIPNGNANLLFQYFMVGTMGAITAAGAKSTIQGEWDSGIPGKGQLDHKKRGKGSIGF
jgi:ubiquinol-cytochrome c reductase iron-sulfur subunit